MSLVGTAALPVSADRFQGPPLKEQKVAMGEPQQHRDPPQVPEEQPDRVLTPEQERELTIDIMASWALDGKYPSPANIESINEFLSSGLTADQYIQKLKKKWTPAEDD